MTEQSDKDIAIAVQKGDIDAFGILVERYEAKMKRYTKRFLYSYEDAEDTVQDVFIKAYTNIQSFNATRKFSPWLYRIAHNTAINLIKKRGKEAIPFFDPDTLFPHPVAKQKTDDSWNEKELKDALDTCLDKLKPTHREPLILYFFEDMDYKSISDVLHIPTSTVGVRISRAKKKLRELYSSTQNEPPSTVILEVQPIESRETNPTNKKLNPITPPLFQDDALIKADKK